MNGFAAHRQWEPGQDPRTFADCEALARTRKRKLGNNTYLVERDDGGYGIRLHSTEVVVHYSDRVVLDSGGWQTMTTRDRMNRFSHCRVWTDKGVMYTTGPAGQAGDPDLYKAAGEVPFADGMAFHADGTVTGAGEDPARTRKLRQRINKYARDYADALFAGEIPPPGQGDCWGCYMKAANDDAPANMFGHIEAHLEEKYYVPSLLVRAEARLSPIARDIAYRCWHGQPVEDCWKDGFIREQITKAVRWFCLSELGLST